MIYDKFRSEIKNGDVLMYMGNSLLSKLIRFVTKSNYSHAGIAVWWNDRLMVLEAVGKGVILTPMSKNVSHYNGWVDWLTATKPISKPKRLRMVQFAQKELGKEYSKWKLIIFGYILILGKDKDKRDKLRQANKLFCSQYVAQIYNSAGIDLKEGVSDRFTSPKDIAHSDKLAHVRRLKTKNILAGAIQWK